MATINRRSFITELISFVAAPAIVRAGSLMPVKQMIMATLDCAESESVTAHTVYFMDQFFWIIGNTQMVAFSAASSIRWDGLHDA